LLGAAALQALAQRLTVTAQVEFSAGTRKSVNASNAVLWLLPLRGSGDAAASKRFQLAQKNKIFSPHLMVVPVGSTIDFPNNDPFFHNVFSLFEGKRFDLGLYEAGTSRGVVFNRTGVSYIFCNIHPEMSAVVIALDTPYYGISNHKGAVAISDVSPGDYEIRIWHERVLPETLKRLSRRISVSQESRFLGIIQLQEQRNVTQPHKNKYGRDYDPVPGGPVRY
jgi:plastocyanin